MAKPHSQGSMSKSPTVKVIDISDLRRLKENLEAETNRDYILLQDLAELYSISSSNAARFFSRKGKTIIKKFNSEHHREMLYVKKSDAEDMIREKSSGRGDIP